MLERSKKNFGKVYEKCWQGVQKMLARCMKMLARCTKNGGKVYEKFWQVVRKMLARCVKNVGTGYEYCWQGVQCTSHKLQENQMTFTQELWTNNFKMHLSDIF